MRRINLKEAGLIARANDRAQAARHHAVTELAPRYRVFNWSKVPAQLAGDVKRRAIGSDNG